MAKHPHPAVATATGTKKRKAKLQDREDDFTENEETVTEHQSNDNTDEPLVRKRPKRAAACYNFKEKELDLSEKDLFITVKESRVEEEEINAVSLTKTEPEDCRPSRKLIDFTLHDADGTLQPFEMSELDGIFITALVMPLDDGLEKDREKGIHCSGFGRIKDWTISGYDEGVAVIWVSTEIADYKCVKPASSYRSYFDHFNEKARVCVEVYKKLTKSVGGNPQIDLEELLASVVRSINSNRKSGGTLSKDFVVSIGEFIYSQLVGLDNKPDRNDEIFATLPVLVALRNESKSRVDFNKFSAMPSSALKIKDEQCKEVCEDDEKLARLLQEEEEWKMMKQRGKRGTSQKNVYIKISETEIANDYPLPAYYKSYSQEMDEYIFDNDIGMFDLPVRILNNWALYNSDSRLIPLELIPMKSGAENDTVIFGSGFMRDDDGSCCSTAESVQLSSSSSKSCQEDQGISIYLSPIKEWVIEFGGSMICITIRTDVAWYKLRQPTKQYAPWCDPVLKTARLAVSIITLLKEQTRASKLSFTEVIKKVAEFNSGHPAFISSNTTFVERYVVVHGQIILQQFADFPDESIRRSAFVTGLMQKMEERRHTKLVMKKKSQSMRGENLNPSAKMGPILRRKLMRATTTRFISKIWGDYYATHFPEDTKEDGNEQKEIDEEQEENEDDDTEEEVNVEIEQPVMTPSSARSRKSPSKTCKEVEWKGQTAGKTVSGEVIYKCATVRGLTLAVGQSVTLEDDSGEAIMCFTEFMYEKHDGTKMIHGRIMQKGFQTVLGNAANEWEVFLTNDCLEFEVGDIKELVTVNVQLMPWGHKYRKENSEVSRAWRAKAQESKKKGLPVEYLCKSLYWPEKGGFFSVPHDKLGIGTGACSSCEERKQAGDEFKILSDTSFAFKNIRYNVDDYLYIRPEFFSQGEGQETYKAGRNVGLKPYAVCHVLSIHAPSGSKKVHPESTKVKVRRFYRPDDISSTKAYTSDIREVYYSEDVMTVPVTMIEGKCEVRMKDDLPNSDLPVVVEHVFYCEHLFDPVTGALKQLPPNVRIMSLIRRAPSASKKSKGKEICDDELAGSDKKKDMPSENSLATLDIFAGCGGLSEGLQLAGASQTKWAIEYEEPAGEAFGENHPEAAVFVENCNVILKAIMDKCGDADDCISTSEAAERASKLSDEKTKKLPVPGEVDFINGGPPCQYQLDLPFSVVQYGSEPVSWFQKKIRGSTMSLNDHISKEMNELNLIRCKRIPKRPGCDWHDLPEEKVKLSTGQVVDLIPWCLPNTAKRHNQWKGLYGRLDWEGNFPTSVTDPQPMGKVGMCFHPEQDRIITVRECARSQGFPDSYHFAGNIQCKHRQIGNAVPPPLAYALGRKLKEAIDAKR
ncbi:unnamed protein product [Urochloa decumbens]|uniref:DNA (cytosine-5)-methyltransferase n=1 Tax=Urochloa decumbens TaxID=240449 RepID=A0ABC8Y520_9POAL